MSIFTKCNVELTRKKTGTHALWGNSVALKKVSEHDGGRAEA